MNMLQTSHNCALRQRELFDGILGMFQVLYPDLDWTGVEDCASFLRHEFNMTSQFGPLMTLPYESHEDYVQQAMEVFQQSSLEGQLVMKAFMEACSLHRVEAH